MSDVMVIDIGREALLMLLYMAGPMLILALVVGLSISLFQAATQLNEMTLTFIPKILSVGLALLFFLPTMIQIFKDFYFSVGLRKNNGVVVFSISLIHDSTIIYSLLLVWFCVVTIIKSASMLSAY